MTSVSVVIPCYNYGHFLHDAVGSALNGQGDLDVRVLIIDDASTDGSADVARGIASREPRVEVVVHARNRGHISTYNEGLLDWADGDYSVLLSADDRLTPGSLARAADLLKAHPGVGFAYGWALHFRDGEPLPPARTAPRGWSVWPGRWWIEQRFRAASGGITSPEVVVRTSLQQKVGGYDPRLPHSGDMEMWMRLAAHADVGHLRGVDQAYYRTHGRNMNSSYSPVMDLHQRLSAYEAVLERCGHRLPDPDHLSSLVRRQLSSDALRLVARTHCPESHLRQGAEELETFALDCWPDAHGLPAYRALQVRRAIDHAAVLHVRPDVVYSLADRARGWRQRRRWRLHGF